MSTSEEKRAIIAKLSQELQEEEDDQLVEKLLKNIAAGPRRMFVTDHSGRKGYAMRIVASAVKQKYGCGTISTAVLKKLENRLGVDNVQQFHEEDPDADYCGDGSYTWLQIGPTKTQKIKQLQDQLNQLQNE